MNAVDPNQASAVGSEAFDDPSQDAGLLVVMLYGARNLSGTTSLGLSNPFCYISVDGMVVRSRADKNTSAHSSRGSPSWNQLFELPVRNPNSARLHVEVVDRYGLKHRTIGIFSMSMASLKDGQRRDLWVPLRGSIGDDGRLHLGLQYQAYVYWGDDEWIKEPVDQQAREKETQSIQPSQSIRQPLSLLDDVSAQGNEDQQGQPPIQPMRVPKTASSKTLVEPSQPGTHAKASGETISFMSGDNDTIPSDNAESNEPPLRNEDDE